MRFSQIDLAIPLEKIRLSSEFTSERDRRSGDPTSLSELQCADLERAEKNLRKGVMTDYESGKKARLEREPLLANPYWGWFRRLAWERGWLDEDGLLAARQDIKTTGSQQSLSCH
jgi:hypothetical protein